MLSFARVSDKIATGGRTVAGKKAGKKSRDIEKAYPKRQFIAKLRRLADTLESGGRFRIQVAGERVDVPGDVVINIEHEREGANEELEFQLVWKNDPKPKRA